VLLAALGFVLVAVAAFFGIVRAVMRIVARLLLGGPVGRVSVTPHGGRGRGLGGSRPGLPCPNARCLHRNVPKARFCAQCGQPLVRRQSAVEEGVTL
jgi:hypothetical protein